MMARSDGRIEPGQRLSRAISARAWNRAQEAADIVLGEQAAGEAGPRVIGGLPQVRCTLPFVGHYGQAARVEFAPISATGIYAVSSQTPGTVRWQFSDDEKKMPVLGEYLGGGTAWLSGVTDDYNGPIAICTENNSRVFAISGMAVVRIRVWNYLHRFARFASFLTTGPTFPASVNTDAAGCLDSTFHGPVRILGYAAGTDRVSFRHVTGITLTWPSFEYRWALVQF